MSTVNFENVVELEATSSPMLLYGLILGVLGLLWLYHYIQMQSHLAKLGNKIPGPTALPLIGNALLMVGKSPTDLIMVGLQISSDLGDVVRGWLGYKLIIFLVNPDDVEVILNSPVHIDKSDEYKFFKPWLGDGLLISTGEKWRSHRKMIAPAFHLNILKSFIGVFNTNSRAVCDSLFKEVGKTFDVHDYLSGVTVDILLETAMGVTKKTHGNSGFAYAMAVMKMCDIIHQRHVRFLLRSEKIFNMTYLAKKQKILLNVIHGLTSKVIKRRKEELQEKQKSEIVTSRIQSKTRDFEYNNLPKKPKEPVKGLRDDLDENDENDIGEKRRLAFLDLMLEASKDENSNISDREIKEEVDTIMFEGHDTTAAGSSFVLCLLGTHQNVQDKVYQELMEIFGTSDRDVTFQDTLEMKYLERVIMETFRMYPPVPLIARKLNQDVEIKTNNYVLPRGSTVVVGTLKMHRNPKIFSNPDVFDPDNFLPERTQERHYYSYIPFSAGPRSCVGRKYAMLKLKVLLATVLRRYHILSNLTEQDYKLQGDIILKRADGFRIQIQPRNH